LLATAIRDSMPTSFIDLRSDTVTRPSPAMRSAMAEAPVGDDVLDGDPTVHVLEARVAALLGKERALFFPSGTMANQTGVWLMSRRGTEVLLDAEAHLIHWEIAGLAALCGVQPRPVRGSGPVFDADALRAHIRPASPNAPAASLVCVENTHNGAGGKVTSLEGLRAIQQVAREHGLPVHMDGARLWNASVATGTSVAEFASCADTVMVSFSKGLGAPVGAALAGSNDAMRDAWQARKRFGGGMRQSGILAAGALYGIAQNWPRMHEDHERARELADAVDGAGGASVVQPDTNIVMIDLPAGITADRVAARCAEQGVKIAPWNASRVRAVTHLDVNREDVRRAGEVLASVLGQEATSR
jgi:threonine aldolase